MSNPYWNLAGFGNSSSMEWYYNYKASWISLLNSSGLGYGNLSLLYFGNLIEPYLCPNLGISCFDFTKQFFIDFYFLGELRIMLLLFGFGPYSFLLSSSCYISARYSIYANKLSTA